jgi:hypothetical protein
VSFPAHQLLLVGCLVTGPQGAANDPFVGKWKVNPSESRLPDEMKVGVAGQNRYVLTFAPGLVDTIVADGSDHPGLGGTTLSITVEGPDAWRVIRKQQGRMLLSANWTLSGDGKTLTDVFTGYHPDGSTMIVRYVYQRTAGSSGFMGTWDSVKEELSTPIELTIQVYQGDGLSFDSPGPSLKARIKFDGKDYPDLSSDVPPGTVLSGQRMSERSLEIKDKIRGKVVLTRRIDLSADLKTLTLTVRQGEQGKPISLVFDRE